MLKSKALEVNLADSYVDVAIDPKYSLLEEVFAEYFGIMDGLTVFLKELSHPLRNRRFIVKEARRFALDYFHILKTHSRGGDAVRLLFEIFFDVFNDEKANRLDIKTDAADYLLLFVNTIIRDSEERIQVFIPVLERVFQKIAEYPSNDFFPFLKSYYQINRIAETLLETCEKLNLTDRSFEDLNALLLKYYNESYDYWLDQEDPELWFTSEEDAADKSDIINQCMAQISHAGLKNRREKLAAVSSGVDSASPDLTRALLELPGFSQVVAAYREIPQRLLKSDPKGLKGRRLKVIFLFHIMNIEGLSSIHEDALRDINRTVGWLIGNEKPMYIWKLIERTFSILAERIPEFPSTSLNLVLNMGKGLYKTDEKDLINYFIESAVKLGFQSPGVGGVDNDWQVAVNSAHIQNVRVWMELISLSPKWSTRLISDLIIHLTLYGVFIRDTDLFPRDISGLLNSDIEPVYNLIKQLTKIFPAYFNDIGAEGKLRDISTEIDEITHRKDKLIHFLRKQVHVEGSNRVTGFIEGIMEYWRTGDKSGLEQFLPPNIHCDVPESGIYLDGVFRILNHSNIAELDLPRDFLMKSDGELERRISSVEDAPEADRKRVFLLAVLYKLLRQKYDMAVSLQIPEGFDTILPHLKTGNFPHLEPLQKALSENNLREKIFGLLEYLEKLKGIILSPEKHEPVEDIYKKRHITVDIPSMYGSYHEPKFDALGFTFRIESLLNVCFEELINDIDLTLVTKATFYEIFDMLLLFDKALRVDGIESAEIAMQLDMLNHSLEARGFTATQYIDIFKGLARAVNNLINDYFHNVHRANIYRILDNNPFSNLHPKYQKLNDDIPGENVMHTVSEIFFRNLLAQSLGLQQLDLFLSRILKTLFKQLARLEDDKLRLLLNYDPKQAIMALNKPKDTSSRIIYLGNKGFNLAKLTNFGMPIPPGFIITAEVFKCRAIVDRYEPLNANFKDQVASHILDVERLIGKRFGDAGNPLLFSVRSGSAISQPGMMDTFLNVGINEQIAEGMAASTNNKWFAWDNYRRFLQCYGMTYGLERDDFDAVIGDEKKRLGIALKRDITGDQMRRLALQYKQMVIDSGITIEEDPFKQLILIIRKVMESWESPKAHTYRKIMGISDDWGTAVTVQSMVYGNMSPNSGTGVIFTHNPRWSGDIMSLWGDFTVGNQGEDVVSGLVTTMPITIMQQSTEMRNTDTTLETIFPEIYKALETWAYDLIYNKKWSPQEMEFTFESPSQKDLYILQTRNMTIRQKEKATLFDSEDITGDRLLGNGIGVSGGAMSGRIVFTLEEIYKWRSMEPDRSLILVRGDTVPDDIREIHAADGLITGKGGVTSHASVVAHGLGKTCVVGCGNLVCDEKEKVARFDGTVLKSEDFISIDGQGGAVYKGLMKVLEE